MCVGGCLYRIWCFLLVLFIRRLNRDVGSGKLFFVFFSLSVGGLYFSLLW